MSDGYRDALGDRPESLADLQLRDKVLRQLNDRSAVVLPTPSGFPEMEEPKHKPDGPWLRAIRTIFYIVGIITCVAVLIAIFDAYVLMDNIREAVKAWEDAISGPGLLGN
jgi:hypothetical protein